MNPEKIIKHHSAKKLGFNSALSADFEINPAIGRAFWARLPEECDDLDILASLTFSVLSNTHVIGSSSIDVANRYGRYDPDVFSFDLAVALCNSSLHLTKKNKIIENIHFLLCHGDLTFKTTRSVLTELK